MELMDAAEKGEVEEVTRLLNNGELVDVGDLWTGWTPLHVAAEGGREAVVEVLLRHNADSSLVTDTGYTALHLAASGGHTKVCQMLIQAGAPLDQVTEAGLRGAPIHYAAGKGILPVVEELLLAGAQVDTLSEDGCTAVYYAVLGRHPHVIIIIIVIIIFINVIILKSIQFSSSPPSLALSSSVWRSLYLTEILSYL